MLEQAGFGILAPPWWRSSRARLGLKLKAKSSTPAPGNVAGNGIGLDGLCKIEWNAVLGDDPIGLKELQELARLKQPLVRIRGQWVEMQANDIEAAIAAVSSNKANGKRKGDGASADPNAGTDAAQMTAGDVLMTALGIQTPLRGLPVTVVEADGWLGNLLAGADDHRLKERKTPTTFDGQLRPYQERGLGWLAFLGQLGLGACLADDMGLGKTAQLLALLLDERPESDKPKSDKAAARSRHLPDVPRRQLAARSCSFRTGSLCLHASRS